MKIKGIRVEEVKDSRGQGTVAVFVKSENGTFTASSPSGKSTGKYETPAFVNNVQESISKLESLGEKIMEVNIKEFSDLEKIEEIVGKKEVGANTLFALEAAILKALAAEHGLELWQFLSNNSKRFPYPIGNVMGGGLHTELTNGKRADFQEFEIIPRFEKFSENVKAMKRVHHLIGEMLKERKAASELNDENAWSCEMENEACLTIVLEARAKAKEEFGERIEMGIDLAASTFFKAGKYNYKNPPMGLKLDEQIDYVEDIAKRFNLFYLEDPLDEEAFAGFKVLREEVNKDHPCLVVGDDLTASNLQRFVEALRKKSINGIIIKPNQNGSLIEIKKLIDACKKYGIITIMSHRSGETTDNTIADLAFAWQVDFIKTGVMGKERDAKLNRLIEIEKKLG